MRRPDTSARTIPTTLNCGGALRPDAAEVVAAAVPVADTELDMGGGECRQGRSSRSRDAGTSSGRVVVTVGRRVEAFTERGLPVVCFVYYVIFSIT